MGWGARPDVSKTSDFEGMGEQALAKRERKKEEPALAACLSPAPPSLPAVEAWSCDLIHREHFRLGQLKGQTLPPLLSPMLVVAVETL